MNYLEELLSSIITTTKDNFNKFEITDSGLYILHPNFDLESTSLEKYLKVGMTVESKGLKGRLGTHFSNNKSSTVLGRHLSLDITFEEKFGFLLDELVEQSGKSAQEFINMFDLMGEETFHLE